MEVTVLLGLAQRIFSNGGPSGKDSATTRCAGEHAMTLEVRLKIRRGFRSVISVCGCRGSWGFGVGERGGVRGKHAKRVYRFKTPPGCSFCF